MPDNIVFWRGQRVSEMSADDLRQALAELYRDHEQVQWELYKATKGKKGRNGATA